MIECADRWCTKQVRFVLELQAAAECSVPAGRRMRVQTVGDKALTWGKIPRYVPVLASCPLTQP